MTNTYRRTIIDRWRRENENDNIIGVLQPRAVRAIHDPCTCACARSCMCAAEKYAPRRIRFGSRSRRERSRTWSGATFLPFSSCIECETRETRRVDKHDRVANTITVSPNLPPQYWIATSCWPIIWATCYRVFREEWQHGEYFMTGG